MKKLQNLESCFCKFYEKGWFWVTLVFAVSGFENKSIKYDKKF